MFKWTGWVGQVLIIVPVAVMTWEHPAFGVVWTFVALATVKKERAKW